MWASGLRRRCTNTTACISSNKSIVRSEEIKARALFTLHLTFFSPMKRSVTSLPLHTGKAPRWLFQRMTCLSAAMAELVIREQGAAEFLPRIADPVWFQAFGCLVGFDWHSSGVTTILWGALKEGLARITLFHHVRERRDT